MRQVPKFALHFHNFYKSDPRDLSRQVEYYQIIITAKQKKCNPFDRRRKIKYTIKVTGTDSRVCGAKAPQMRKVRAPQGKNNG